MTESVFTPKNKNAGCAARLITNPADLSYPSKQHFFMIRHPAKLYKPPIGIFGPKKDVRVDSEESLESEKPMMPIKAERAKSQQTSTVNRRKRNVGSVLGKKMGLASEITSETDNQPLIEDKKHMKKRKRVRNITELEMSVIKHQKKDKMDSDQVILDKVYGRGRIKKNPDEIPEDKQATGDLGKDLMSFDSKQTVQKMQALNFLRRQAKVLKMQEEQSEE